MTTSKFHRLITKKNLLGTWESFYKKAKKQTSSGIDDMTIARFAEQKNKFVDDIYRRIHSKEGYVFSSLSGHPVPKPNSTKKRIICIPTVADRIVQRCIGEHLTIVAEKKGILNEASFGFIPTRDGAPRGVAAARNRAISLRNQNSWAYKSDISAFFDNIPRTDVVKQTVSILNARSFEKAIQGIVCCEIDERDPAIARIVKENGILRGKGVRQGMPLSPLFSNIILRNFDNTLLAKGKKLVRYADDFIVLAKTKEECFEIDELARKLLQPLGLVLPPIAPGSKTQIKSPDEEIEFLGLSLTPVGSNNYRLLLASNQLEEIKRTINRMKDVKELVRLGVDITKFLQKLERQISGYKAAYKDAQNISELEKILNDAKSKILRQVFVGAFSEERVHQLNDDYKQFFCLTPLKQKKRK